MEGGHLLKLIIEKGHREGETLEFQPGKPVKIGRVVRGNTLAIKDAGVSSNHLSIEFVSGEWILSDLDSSNGTIVNGEVIKADNPAKLVDGDTIKIGERSSIKVSIGVPNDDVDVRRNPRRRTVKNAEQESVGIATTRSRRGGKVALIVDVKKPELGLGFDGDVGVSRVRKAVTESVVDVQESLPTAVEVGTNQTRSTRSLRNQLKTNPSLLPPLSSTIDTPSVLKEEALAQIVEKKTQRGRGRQKKLVEDPPLTTVNDSMKEEEALPQIVEKKTQRGRGRKNKPVEDLPLTSRTEAFAGNSSLKDSHNEEETIKEDTDPRNENDVPFVLGEEALPQIVEKKTQRGRGRKNKLVEDLPLTFRTEAFAGNSSLMDSHYEEETIKEDTDPRKENDIPFVLGEEASAQIVEKKTKRGRGRKKKVEENPALTTRNEADFAESSGLKDSHFEEEPIKVQSGNNSDPTKEDDEIDGNELMLQEDDEMDGNEPVLQEDDEIDGNEPVLQEQDAAADFDEEPDLEKMTLGDWFDYLIVSLSKQIRDEAEERIADMRMKAEIVNKLVVQTKNRENKGKRPLV
ncbi:FHA domain-containing protein At4g14490-like isoform X2 [Impatiens glandulifera]|uniref:FHA domain-containing protein At4g14490-like isoform X2 n=1 Tax=Impatiens glandulifera TaxID=253017 RepID=UPI001FB0F376|nr:FHA domain-containing protein At4g14490-like isoform X2 [Impatiens glandulifera]